MPGPSPPAQAPERRFLAPVLGYPARATLNSLMSLAVIVLEWRIRRALRSDAEPGHRARQ
jgi:hypothetical protein